MNYENSVVKKMNFNGQKVKKWYHNGVKVFSSGNIVTYHVDAGISYAEEVDSEATVLSPKTFTPTKSGWTFAGWREDKTASSSVIQSKVMGDDPITLYAVFNRTLTATFSGNGATSGSVSSIYDTQYYNNGNYNNPTITLPANDFTRTNYKFTGWNLGAVGDKVTISDDTSVSAQWLQSVYNYGYTGGMQSFTAPESGTYQLEVWGAQGAANYSGSGQNGSPGYGGYGKGNVDLTKGQVIYICVGGMGQKGTSSGGYNGGGRGFVSYSNAQAGGGATHIGTINGVLTSYYGKLSNLFIAAGGGGGAGIRFGSDSGPGAGGSGGGSSGGAGTGNWGYSGKNYGAGEGGTQSGGGAASSGDDGGSFGTGGYGHRTGNDAGGGGGLYGGGAGNTYGDNSYGGAGGGSGYIGGVTKGSWSNGVRSGDGYATITLQ